MTIEKDISTALQTAAIAAVTGSSVPAMPIKALGRITPVPNDQKYVEFIQIRNNRQGDYWNGKRVYQGLFRILLHWPTDDKGDYAPLEFIDEIAANFNDRPIYYSGAAAVKIYEEPNVGDSIEDGQQRVFPVSLSYRCFA